MNETERTMEHDPGGAGATVDGMEGFDSAEGFDSTLEDILPNVMKRFCPECGEPVARNATGRPRKFCSTECCNAWWRKLWGNGVALPCVYFVLSGIVWASGLDTEKQ